MGGGRAGQEASSSGKGRRVVLEKSRCWYGVPPHKCMLRTLWALRVIGVSVSRDRGRRHGRSGAATTIEWRLVCTRGWGRGHIRSGS